MTKIVILMVVLTSSAVAQVPNHSVDANTAASVQASSPVPAAGRPLELVPKFQKTIPGVVRVHHRDKDLDELTEEFNEKLNEEKRELAERKKRKLSAASWKSSGRAGGERSFSVN